MTSGARAATSTAQQSRSHATRTIVSETAVCGSPATARAPPTARLVPAPPWGRKSGRRWRNRPTPPAPQPGSGCPFGPALSPRPSFLREARLRPHRFARSHSPPGRRQADERNGDQGQLREAPVLAAAGQADARGSNRRALPLRRQTRRHDPQCSCGLSAALPVLDHWGRQVIAARPSAFRVRVLA